MIQYCKLYINRGGKKMKKLLSIFVAVFFILSCFVASASSIFEINESIEWEQSEILILSGSDELDQYQTELLLPRLCQYPRKELSLSSPLFVRSRLKQGDNGNQAYVEK